MLKGVSLQLKIIEFIKRYITENDLKDGDKLPSQKELTDLLGVSRSSLREAVKTERTKDFTTKVETTQ